MDREGYTSIPKLIKVMDCEGSVYSGSGTAMDGEGETGDDRDSDGS